MFIKQLTVRIENRKGSLHECLNALKEAEINILSLSLADSTEYGILRLIVSEPAKAKDVLSEKKFSVRLTDVLAIKIGNDPGALCDVLARFEADVNIEYMYALQVKDGTASIIAKISNIREQEDLKRLTGIELLTEDDIF